MDAGVGIGSSEWEGIIPTPYSTNRVDATSGSVEGIMIPTGTTRRAPIHRLAILSFALSLIALLLAWYGSLHAEKHLAGSPLREARGSANVIAEPGHWYERLVDRAELSLLGERFDQKVLEWTRNSKSARYTLQIVAFVLPFALGLTAAFLGGNALTAIERSGGTRAGNFQGVFAILIGGFAAVIAGCMLVSLYVWPYLPSPYAL